MVEHKNTTQKVNQISHIKAEPGQAEEDTVRPLSYPTIGHIDLGEEDD